MGPRVFLNRDHLFLMAKALGQYHSMTYALRYHNEKQLDALRKQIVPLPFVYEDNTEGANPSLYKVLYRVAFDRFFEYCDRIEQQNFFDKNNSDDLKFLENLQILRKKYFKQPEALLEHLRTSIEENVQDRHFGVILHGDFNRNNVMFRYQNNEKEGNASDNKAEHIKLIDFQELRYGTPAIDLSFFMFINTPENIRADIWMDILKNYHGELHKMLEKTLRGLKGTAADIDLSKVLEMYSFEHFNAHFSRFAFYGVMICLHFLPWLLCSEEECSQLSHYFETDIHGDAFYKISMSAGGDEVNKYILNVVRYASKMGYMDYF